MDRQTFDVAEESYDDDAGRQVRVMALRNTGTGELAEILLNTPGGDNRSTGSGAVNGLLLQDPQSGALREVMPHRRGFVGGLMAPFANRIRHGRYPFGGVQHQLPCNWDETATRITRSGEHAIHGLLPRELDVLSVDTEGGACLRLGTSFDGSDEGYPFRVDLTFSYRLQVDSGFSIDVVATNRSLDGMAAPFMVGWHPYVQLKGRMADTVLAFDPRSGYNMSVPERGGPAGPARDSHPTGSTVLSDDFTQGRALGDRYWDDGFKATASSRNVSTLETRVQDSVGQGSTVVVWQDAQGRFIQVYTGLREQRALAIEPMSGQTDCFNNGDGLVVLQAGETWETSFGARLEA